MMDMKLLKTVRFITCSISIMTAVSIPVYFAMKGRWSSANPYIRL